MSHFVTKPKGGGRHPAFPFLALLFGSDYPFAPEILTGETIKGIAACDGFDMETRRAVERGNALRLFPG